MGYNFKGLVTAALVMAVMAVAPAAKASTVIDCNFEGPLGAGFGPLDYVAGSTACQQTIEPVVNNDAPRPDQVNSLGFFGESNWSWLGTYNTADDNTFPGEIESPSLGFTVTGTGVMGSFSFNTGFRAGELMLVFKGPSSQSGAEPAGIVAYLMGPIKANTSYSFATMFTGDKGQPQDISHISAYFAPIPLPAAGWLLLGGLGALAAVRRRKRAA